MNPNDYPALTLAYIGDASDPDSTTVVIRTSSGWRMVMPGEKVSAEDLEKGLAILSIPGSTEKESRFTNEQEVRFECLDRAKWDILGSLDRTPTYADTVRIVDLAREYAEVILNG